ncbi:hypothetical protein [Herbiconiux daphne]|uniref:Bacterial Pleckstrin homology domain-containing protein n=1 Tax=Herbiconiux daphne TaxID=2970914 RepID=A0ABT2H8L6_9MICO|nr:hypothetical protein [Herbiconiux daphne]MCS5736281.1 hypothetical protein [Herbiconiux daphne]
MNRSQYIAGYAVFASLFALCLIIATVRAIEPGGPQVWGLLIPLATGMALVLAVACAFWLPGRLTFLSVQRLHPRSSLLFALRDKSMDHATSAFHVDGYAGKLNLYSTFEATSTSLQIWAGGLNPIVVARIPRTEIVAFGTGFGPFFTAQPIDYMTIYLSNDVVLNVVPYGPSGMLPTSKHSLDLIVRELASDLDRTVRHS